MKARSQKVRRSCRSARRGTRPSHWLALMLLLCGVTVGCDRLRPPPAAPPAPPKPPEVLFTLPTTAEITDYEDFTGRTVAIPTIDIRARVTGYLEKISFKEREGGDVEQGAVLFEIDPRPYKVEVMRAEANLLQARAHLKRLDLDLARAKKLIDTKSISREQYDLVTGDKAEAEAQVERSKADWALARLNLSYTEVKAPIRGRVSRTQLDQGNLVKADETILTTIVSIDPIYAYFEVDERTMLRIRRYIEEGRLKSHDERSVPVELGLQDDEGFPHNGTVNFFDNRLDTATGTLQIRGVFKNSNHVLTPGLFARVRLPIGRPYRAILISEQALGTDQEQKFVYVIDNDNKAQYRRVEVGKFQRGQRVILKGLAEGERVVTSGLQRIRPGAVVQPKLDTPTVQQEQQPASPPEVAAGATGKDLSQK